MEDFVTVGDVVDNATTPSGKPSRQVGRYFEETSSKRANSQSNPESGQVEELSGETVEVDLSVSTGASLSNKRRRWQDDPFRGDTPKAAGVLLYSRGAGINTKKVKTTAKRAYYTRLEAKVEHASNFSALVDSMLSEQPGYIDSESVTATTQLTQEEIAKVVDISSAAKHFDLRLKDFGPYRINYTRNGRYLLLGGGRGHVAAIDWITKRLMCEINVMEGVRDVRWLHIETMFAVAQKRWTYIYDNQGIELHCLKMLDQVHRLDFLPYHFLLVSGNEKGYLCYVDVAVGERVAGFNTRHGRLDILCQNPANATVLTGHPTGCVSMWSPNSKEPLAKMLCHPSPIRAIAVDGTGNYLASTSVDKQLRIWDLRRYGLLESFRLPSVADQVAFSQRRLLAASQGNSVEVYKDVCEKKIESVYLRHRLSAHVSGLGFCPYEDVLGVGHGAGFTSMLVPGAGEPNFDAFESNPFQTKKQRREAEVKMLLEKIQPDLIQLDPKSIANVDVKTAQEVADERNKILFIRPKQIDFEPRYKKKGRSRAGKFEQRKQGVREFQRRKHYQQVTALKSQLGKETHTVDDSRPSQPKSALDRFKKKS